MLEREEELGTLRAALGEVRSGKGRVFLVSGDAGIGKTTLVRALAEAAEATDVRVRWGRSWEEGGARAYWPWVQVLRQEIAETDGVDLARRLGPAAADLAQLVPEVAERFGLDEPAAPSGSEGARFRLFEAVSHFLQGAAYEGPLLVILEDLHAADEPSLSLMQFVARDVTTSPMLLVGTYRDAEARSSLRHSRLLRSVGREGEHILLSGLGSESVAMLLERSLKSMPSQSLVRDVHDTTEGNPLFVGEIARLLASQRRGLQGRLPVPEAMHEVVARRVDALDHSVRQALTVASVMGREFDIGSLSEIVGHDVRFLLDSLGDAARAGLVEEVGLNRWSFAHAVVRESLYDRLPLTEQAALHRAAAEVFETSRADALAEIAHHRYQAARTGTDLDRAVAACRAAGEEATTILAFEEAAVWYERALEVLSMQATEDDLGQFELLTSLGETLLRGGARSEGHDAYRRAYEVSRRTGSPELMARAALGVAAIQMEDPDREASAALQEALTMLPEEDSSLRARLLASLGASVPREVVEEDRRLQVAAVEMARRIGDPNTLGEALWMQHGKLRWDATTLKKRLPMIDELVDLAAESGDGERLVLARLWRIADRFEACDIVGARAELAVATREAEALRLPFLRWGATHARATLSLLEGRLDETERLARAAHAIGVRAGTALPESYFMNHLMSLRREQGRFEEAEELCRQAMERWPRSDYPRSHALFLTDLGRIDEARVEFEELFSSGLWQRGNSVFWASNLAELCHRLDDRERAVAVYDALLPFAGRHVVYPVMSIALGVTDRYLGLLATLLCRFDEAAAHFTTADQLHERMGARVWAAHGYADHGRMLLLRGAPGDEARGNALLARSLQGYEALGMTAHAKSLARVTTRSARTSFRQDGDEWVVEYEGRSVRLRDSKGLHYLAHLLANLGTQVHALELVGEGRPLGQDGAAERLRDLQAEIDEARAANDLARLERAEDEFDDLLARLGREADSPAAERARQSVTRALKGAVERIAAGHPALGEHLRTTVRTGIYSSYTPDPRSPIRWER